MKKKVLLNVILDIKTKVYQIKQCILAKNKGQGTLLIVSLNIPGWPKKNKKIDLFFNKVLFVLKQELNLTQVKEFNTIAGDFYFFSSNRNARFIKYKCVSIEERYLEFRLIDIDCIDLYTGAAINRHGLGIIPRQCLLCNNNADHCIVMQKHNIEDLNKLAHLYIDNFLKKNMI